MKKKGDDKINDSHEKIYKIIFEKRNTKTKVKVCIGAILILVAVITIIFSIVNLTIKYQNVMNQLQEASEGEENNDYSALIENVSNSIVTISDSEDGFAVSESESNNVTGVVIDSAGVIVTSYSSISEFNNIYVKLPFEEETIVTGTLIAKDEETDIAVIQIQYDGELVPMPVAMEPTVGDDIVVVSNIGGDNDSINIVPGIITANYEYDFIQSCNLFEINATVNKYNTSGAVCTTSGELIGFASYKLSQDYNLEGLTLVVKYEEIEDIIDSTNMLKSILGIEDGGILRDDNDAVEGFYVGQLTKDGSAYLAGIEPTDIIVSVEGYDMESIDEITKLLEQKVEGDVVNCEVLRDGEVQEFQIEIVK